MTKMNNFRFWRILSGFRQIDLESIAGIKKWRVALFESGHEVLTDEELDRLAAVTGIPKGKLAIEVKKDFINKTNQPKRKATK